MWFFVLLCLGIREQTEIKQSVSKLTEEVSANVMLLIHVMMMMMMMTRVYTTALIITSLQKICLLFSTTVHKLLNRFAIVCFHCRCSDVTGVNSQLNPFNSFSFFILYMIGHVCCEKACLVQQMAEKI